MSKLVYGVPGTCCVWFALQCCQYFKL